MSAGRQVRPTNEVTKLSAELAAISASIPPAAVNDGKTWFVSLDGNDTAGTGGIISPFATIAKAATVAVAGDVISVFPGSYAGATLANGVSLRGAGKAKTTITSLLTTGATGLDLQGFSVVFAGNPTCVVNGICNITDCNVGDTWEINAGVVVWDQFESLAALDGESVERRGSGRIISRAIDCVGGDGLIVWSFPAGQRVCITRVIVYAKLITATSPVNEPMIGIGWNGGISNIVDNEELTGLQSTGDVFQFAMEGRRSCSVAGKSVVALTNLVANGYTAYDINVILCFVPF